MTPERIKQLLQRYRKEIKERSYSEYPAILDNVLETLIDLTEIVEVLVADQEARNKK